MPGAAEQGVDLPHDRGGPEPRRDRPGLRRGGGRLVPPLGRRRGTPPPAAGSTPPPGDGPRPARAATASAQSPAVATPWARAYSLRAVRRSAAKSWSSGSGAELLQLGRQPVEPHLGLRVEAAGHRPGPVGLVAETDHDELDAELAVLGRRPAAAAPRRRSGSTRPGRPPAPACRPSRRRRRRSPPARPPPTATPPPRGSRGPPRCCPWPAAARPAPGAGAGPGPA